MSFRLSNKLFFRKSKSESTLNSNAKKESKPTKRQTSFSFFKPKPEMDANESEDEEVDADAVSLHSHNEKWLETDMRKARPSMFSPDVSKIGILRQVSSPLKKSRFSPSKPQTYYFEASGSYVRYYKIRRLPGEGLKARTSFFKSRPSAIQNRIRREEPIACIDMRLIKPELKGEDEKSCVFRLNSIMNEESIELEAPNPRQALSWVRTLTIIREETQKEDDRKSLAISQGHVPEEVPKPAMELLESLNPDMKKAITFDRSEYRSIVNDLLNSDRERNGFSILSWNILADMFVTQTRNPEMYRHCDPGALPWAYRSKRIFRHLKRSNADIICLQEVEQKAFDGDLGAALRAKGYVGQIDCNQKKTPDGIVILPGTATFYKKNMFELAWRERSYRSLVIGLKIKRGIEAGNVVAVVNSHLEGAPWRTKDRASQMKSAFKKLDLKKKETKYTVICGDFNDGAHSELCQKIMTAKNFVSAYDGHEARDATCLLTPLDPLQVNVDDHRVDHIFFDNRLILRGAMGVMDERWSREGTLEQGLPSLLWPSDHLSIGAVFHFNQNSPMFAPEPIPVKEKIDPFQVMTSKEIWHDPSICPLTDEEKRLYVQHDTLMDAAKRTKKAKPTPDSIRRMREKAVQRQEFIKTLDPPKQDFVRNFIALQRREMKDKKSGKKKKQNSPAAKKDENQSLSQGDTAPEESSGTNAAKMIKSITRASLTAVRSSANPQRGKQSNINTDSRDNSREQRSSRQVSSGRDFRVSSLKGTARSSPNPESRVGTKSTAPGVDEMRNFVAKRGFSSAHFSLSQNSVDPPSLDDSQVQPDEAYAGVHQGRPKSREANAATIATDSYSISQ